MNSMQTRKSHVLFYILLRKFQMHTQNFEFEFKILNFCHYFNILCVYEKNIINP